MSIWSRLFLTQNAKRGSSRINIEEYHKAQMMVDEKVYQIKNISLSGVGFVIEDENYFEVGQKYEGSLILNKNQIPVILEVRRKESNIIGAILEIEDRFSKELLSFFEGELNALSLRKISIDSLKRDENGEPCWFYGDRNHELYLTTQGDVVTTFQLNYHGHIIVADNEKFHLGVQVDENTPGEHKTSKLVSKTVKVDDDFKLMILRFVKSINDLLPEHKTQILARLSTQFGVTLDA